MNRTHTSKSPAPIAAPACPQKKAEAVQVSEPDDAYEQEADRMADAAVTSAAGSGLSLSRIAVGSVQRDEGAKPKTEDEKYKEAAKKLGEAFLETPPGREIQEKVEKLGEAFVATLPGKVITGSTITGAIAALAATHRELPMGIPDIPLDKVSDRLQGWKLKITYDGPVDKPTKVMGTFVVPLAPPKNATKKPTMTGAEKFRAETARMAQEQQKFRESLKTPQERENEQRMMDAWLRSRLGAPGALPGLAGAEDLPPEFKLTGERPRSEAPQEEKKKEGGDIRRKAAGDRRAPGAPPVVRDALASSGRPLDTSLRTFMQRRFGCDFAQVRLHTDATADRSARAISARAYTVGDHVVFADGEYSPHSHEGRRLLAHELAHVVQQQERPLPSPDLPLIRRKEQKEEQLQTPEQALRAALKGDDDAVRDLTKTPQWDAVKLTPEEAAALLILLLEGATLDDDEIAGLAVLRKALKLGVFDDTLGKLGHERRFKQLLDDYHGAEYRELLELLSAHIDKLHIKALYLDAFIAMWWVREHEERAIVVLLERTAVADLFALLTKENRQKELRDAIDTASLSIRYERIAGKVNEMRQADLAAQLKKIFDAKAKTSQAAGKRTPAEVNRLLAAAADDLAGELIEYRKRLREALAAKEPDADAIAKINKEFEQRLRELIEHKQAEFDLELKYDIEFNRLLSNAYSRSWTPEDLKEIDKILAQIPPEILHANPKFRAIRRAGEHPKLGGQAPWSGEAIKLFGDLRLGTTAHELGHVISYDDGEKLQNEFNTEFKWQILTVADFTKLIPHQKKRRELLEKLDEDRAKEREDKGDRHREGDWFYRHDRYNATQYLRHPTDACFITSYAATDRYDDFAESFEEYLVDPKHLRKECPAKYAFMRRRVAVRYLYGKQSAQVLSDFDQEADAGVKALALPGSLSYEFHQQHLKKLREALEKELEATAVRLETQAIGEEPSDKMKRIPLTGTEARDAAKPYRQRLTELLKLLAQVGKPWQAFWSETELFENGAPAKQKMAATLLSFGMRQGFQKEALALMQPTATRILAGQAIDATKWPELDALVAKYKQALNVAPSYLPMYEKAMGEEFDVATAQAFATTEKEEVGPIAWSILRKYPKKDPRRQKIKDYMLQRRLELSKQSDQLQWDIIAQVNAGIPPKKATLTTPEALLKDYERDIKDFIKREGLQLQRKAAGAAGEMTEASQIEPLPDSPGQPLDSATRAFMEARFGHDFGAVRIHADAHASAAARSASAHAYTVGHDIVFGYGQYAPHSRAGQRLIAHELAHVAQQDSPDKPRATAAQAEAEAEAAEQAFMSGGNARIASSLPIGTACKPKATAKKQDQATGILVLKDMKKVAVDLKNGDQYVYTLQWCSLAGGSYLGSMRGGELVIENAESDTVLRFGDETLDQAPDPSTLSFPSSFPVAVMTAFLDTEDMTTPDTPFPDMSDSAAIMAGTVGPRPGETPAPSARPSVVTLTPEEAAKRCESGFLPGSMVFPFQPAGGVFTFDIAPIMAWRDGDRIAVRMPTAVRGIKAFAADVATLPVDVFTVNGYRLDPNELVRVRFYGESGKPTRCVTGEGMLALAEASDKITGVSVAATSLDALMLSPVNEVFAAGARTLFARAMLGTAEAVPQFGGNVAPQAIIRAAEEEAVSKAGVEFAKQAMITAVEKQAPGKVATATAKEAAEKAAMEAVKKTAAAEATKAAEAGIASGLQQAASATLRGAGVAGVELTEAAIAGEITQSAASSAASTVTSGMSAVGNPKGVSVPQVPAAPVVAIKAVPAPNTPEQLYAHLRTARIDPTLPPPPLSGKRALGDNSIYREGIESPFEAYRLYNEALMKEAFGREVAIYRDATTRKYLVVIGGEKEIVGLGTWQRVLHFHPNPSNVPAFRRPSGVDMVTAAEDAMKSKSGRISEFVETHVDGVGRVRTEFGVELDTSGYPFFVDDPLSGLGVGAEAYASDVEYLKHYVDELAKDTLNFKTGTPEYNEVMDIFDNYAKLLEKRKLLKAKP
jgi:hypothetical protein